jgi:hypothetical protein
LDSKFVHVQKKSKSFFCLDSNFVLIQILCILKKIKQKSKKEKRNLIYWAEFGRPWDLSQAGENRTRNGQVIAAPLRDVFSGK